MKLDMSTEGRAGAVMTEEVLDQGKVLLIHDHSAKNKFSPTPRHPCATSGVVSAA